jgi:hypothetical protein
MVVDSFTDDEMVGEECGGVRLDSSSQTRRSIWSAPFGIRSLFCYGTKPSSSMSCCITDTTSSVIFVTEISGPRASTVLTVYSEE